MEKLLIVLYSFILLLGTWVESPSSQRLIMLLLIGLTSGLSVFLPLLNRVKQKPRLAFVLSLAVSPCLLLLEQNSKYSTNDFFHMLYFIALIGLYQQKDSKRFLQLVPLLGLAISWKYIYIARVSPELLKVPQVVVAIGLFVLVSIILWLGLKLSREQAQLNQLNQVLEERQVVLHSANARLEELMEELEGLTVYRERQKMAREIHDTVGHELTALTMKLELSKHFSKTNPEQGMALLEESIADSRSALRSTRQVVETLTNSRRSAEDLNQLVARYDMGEGLQLELKGQSCIEALSLEQSHAVYRAVQEGITNCLKHSDANRLSMHMGIEQGQFTLRIEDNGSPLQTSHSVEEHFGLKGMRARMLELGGSFAYKQIDGFSIFITLPLEEEPLQ